MTILIPLAIAAGVGLTVALGAAEDGAGPPTNLADLWAADEADRTSDPEMLVEPGAGPEPLVDGVTVRSLDAAPELDVDISLLRYLGVRGDKRAAEAEIARLKALHPGWEPPADLFGEAKPAVDVAPLWELYNQQDYAGVRAAIGRLRMANPDWQPPANLIQLMETNETRAAIEGAGGAGDWQKVIEIARGHPEQFDCGRIDNMWRLAEAQVRSGDREAAAETYARIIRSCDDADHRFATLQKAKDLLGQSALAELLPAEVARPRTAAQQRRLESLREPARPARAASPGARQPAELRRLYAKGATVEDAVDAMELARQRKDNAAARKIGWLLHDAGRDDEAVEWFSLAMSWRSDPEAAKGLATAYAAKGDVAGLEAMQGKWPKIVTPLLADTRGAALGAAMERSDWQAVLVQTRGAAAVDRVLPRGWALTELERPAEAVLSFQQVLHSNEATPSQRDEGAYGLVRSYISLELFRDAEATMQRYGVAPDRVFEVRSELLAKAAAEAFGRGDYRQTLVLLEQRQAIAEPTRGLLLQEAWARYHTNDLTAAKKIFESQHRLLASKETASGLEAVESRLHPN